MCCWPVPVDQRGQDDEDQEDFSPFGALNTSHANILRLRHWRDRDGTHASFRSMPDVSSEIIYSFCQKTSFLSAREWTGLDALGIIAVLEPDLGVPVVQPIVVCMPEIRRRPACSSANQRLQQPA
jgi:hypothetical protein